MALPADLEKRKYMFSEDMKFSQKAIVFHPTDHNKFLALKREPHDHSRPGKWDLPGGNLHFGQEADAGLRQEVREESGLEIDRVEPVKVWSRYFGMTKTYHLFIGYIAVGMSDTVTLSHEHTDFKWVTKDEFLALDSADYLVGLVKETL